jgi:hypothetical protein
MNPLSYGTVTGKVGGDDVMWLDCESTLSYVVTVCEEAGSTDRQSLDVALTCVILVVCKNIDVECVSIRALPRSFRSLHCESTRAR